jgi:diguanylate cyclase (GGDEF)-like protein
MPKDRLARPLRPQTQVPGRDETLAALETLHARQLAVGEPYSLLRLSIDRFRLINSRFGHDGADEVLRRVGAQTRQWLHGRGLIGRLGGDEYLIALVGMDAASALAAAEQLRARLANLVITVAQGITTVTCSIGLATFPDNGDDTRVLLTATDDAMHEAKRAGRNRVVHASGLASPVLQLAGEVEQALRENRVMPAYQPIFDLESGALVAEEALARLVTTGEHVLAAQEFIEAASRLQLTHRIDRTIVEAALSRWAEHSAAGHDLTIFVNVSPQLLRHPELVRELFTSARRGFADRTEARAAGQGWPGCGFADRTEARAAGQGSPAGGLADGAAHTPLVLEITERELLGDARAAAELLQPFVDLGLKLALDDFGSGYSSFEYLADLPVSFIKIDGRLIQRLHEARVRAIVRGIHTTAAELGIVTLAEFIETDRQANILREIGVRWGQGHHFSRAQLDEKEAARRRRLSVNWTQGYYYTNGRREN